MAIPQCVVLGGGFGGVAAAHRLRERLGKNAEISLVDRRGTFMMGLRILWTVAGQATRAEGTRPLDRLSRKGIRVVRDEAVLIDVESKTVFTRGGGRLRYDALVIALGAEVRPDLVPGYDPVASNLYDPDQAEAIAARVASFDRGRLGIGILGVPYKCPPAPYECAFLIDDVLRRRGVRDRVEMEAFTPQPSSLPVAGTAACAEVEGRLAARGIRFLPNRKVTAVGGREVVFEEDQRVYDLLIAVPPHRAPGVVKQAGLTTGEWIRPDPRTCATAVPGVFAVGDVTEMPLANGMMLPKAGVFAEAQGRAAGDQIARLFGAAEQAAEFDGVGYCYVETGEGAAAAIRGQFYATPEPVVEVAEPSPQTLAEKRKFEAERLAAWF
ncbi:MAG: FAD/NAD(P)-binding oxidoreductase [Armatimonadota bacterium]|nr:FAD/NAD(P)-binding oxidoreductase [Armatimonadota bacterium]